MLTPQNIARHELIGLMAKVVRARNPANLGISGKIVDETFKTLVLEKNSVEKRLFKDQITLQIQLPSKVRVEVDGKLLVARPWERVKKRLPKF